MSDHMNTKTRPNCFFKKKIDICATVSFTGVFYWFVLIPIGTALKLKSRINYFAIYTSIKKPFCDVVQRFASVLI